MREIPVGKIVYKKVKIGNNFEERPMCEGIVTLVVLESGFIADHDRYNSMNGYVNTWQKGRVRKAVVVRVQNLEGQDIDFGKSYGCYGWADAIEYTVGKIVEPHEFSLDNEACAGGIHVFEDRKTAVKYW